MIYIKYETDKDSYDLESMYDAPQLLHYCNTMKHMGKLNKACFNDFEINIVDIQFHVNIGRKIMRRELASTDTCAFVEESLTEGTSFLGINMSQNMLIIVITCMAALICGLIICVICVIVCCHKKNKKTLKQMDTLKKIGSVSSYQSRSRLSGMYIEYIFSDYVQIFNTHH